MKITYIHHSSFVVEDKTENGHQIVLIFDYFEGTLPEFSPEAYLYVFASHKHADHFNLSTQTSHFNKCICTLKIQ